MHHKSAFTLKLIRRNYHGTKEDKEAMEKEYHTQWKELAKSFSNLKRKWKIEADEVGLIGFPIRAGFSDMSKLKVPNFDISKERKSLKKNGKKEEK